MDNHEAAAHFATWHVAGPLERAGLAIEREGSEVTITQGGVRYTISVTAEVERPASRLVARMLA